MGVSEHQYNNDPILHMAVTQIEKGSDPLKIIANLIEVHNMVQTEYHNLIMKISNSISKS